MKEFSTLVDKSIKASIAFDQVSRGFGFYEAIAALFLMAAGMWVGIEVLPPYQTANYGVAVLFFISIC
jgi:ATP-binding cassette, subfamily C (CFTR/MRP), member 4